jgi:MFS family permease
VPETPLAPTRLYTKPFLGVVGINLLSFGQWFSLNPVLPLIILERGGDAALAGLAFAFFSIPSLVFRPIFGQLSDRFGTRVLLLWGTIGIGLAAPVYLLPSFAVLMVIRALHGVVWAAVMTAGPSLMARLAPASRRGEAASVFDLMPSLAQFAMPGIGVLIWTVAGGPAVILFAGLLGLAGSLIVLATAPHDAPISRPTVPPGRQPLLEPSAVLPMTIVVLFMSAGPLFVIFPPILATQNGIPVTELAFYYPVYGIAMVGSRILVSRIIDRLPRLGVIVGGALLAIGGLLGSIQATSILFLSVAGVLHAVAVGVLIPALTSAVIDRAPQGRIGSAMGTYVIGFQFAGGFGAALWGFVIEQSGFLAAYWIAIAVQATLLAFAFVSRQQLERGAARAAH